MPDVVLERGLPANLDAERFVLGVIAEDGTRFPEIAGILTPEDFSLEKHRRIFSRMAELYERGEHIDRVTLINQLRDRCQLESCDGASYIVSLDDGLPAISNVESYARIVKEKSRRRQIIFAAQKVIDYAITDNSVTAHELATEAAQRLIEFGCSDTENSLASVEEIIARKPAGVNRFLNSGEHRRGVETGFSQFDQMTGGLQRGDLIVVAARPSMGKTAFALNVAAHVSIGPQQLSVAVFSLEMACEAIMTRLLCAAARVDACKQRAGFLNQDERLRMARAAEEFRGAKLFIDDTSGSTIMDIHTKLRRLRADEGVDLAIIDYLGLIASHRQGSDNRVRELGEITRYAKLMLAKELDIPVILLSQLSRAPERRPGDHRPILSDLRESGDIEQDADVVAFIYREEMYKPDREDLKGLAELLVAKQRNGPTGRVRLTFLKECTRFENRAPWSDGAERQ